MPDLKISQLTSATTPLAGTEVLPIVQSGSTVKVPVSDLTAGRAVSASALTASSGNLAFTGTAQRITGDFSNATLANRLSFQTSTVNGNTAVFYLPNGTSQTANAQFHNASDPTNAANMLVGATGTEATLRSGITGTGTYLPMTFYTGGSEAMRIDTSGNVGIGTASPGDLLQVNRGSGSGITSGIALTTAAGGVGDGSYIKWTGAVTNEKIARIDGVLEGTDLGSIRFNTGNGADGFAERMRIDSSGNVGIGTASPGSLLDVAGNARATGIYQRVDNSGLTLSGGTVFNTAGSAVVLRGSSAGFNAYGMELYAGGSERLRIDSSGNVGIGTTSLLYRTEVLDTQDSGTGLRITNNSTGASASANLVFGTNIDGQMAYIAVPGGSATDANQLVVATRVNHGIIFRTNNTNRASITAAGNFVAGAQAALATNATDGFLYVPTCAGTPTGTPTAITGMAPIVVNTTNNKLYFYSGGAWRDAGP